MCLYWWDLHLSALYRWLIMERIYLSNKIYYDDLLSLGKDIYKYPGWFNELFEDKSFLSTIQSEDKDKYDKIVALKKLGYISDVFLFKASYILNPYMKLRYHGFIFENYQELGTTMLQYGPIIDVYLKDLLVYHLLSEYMEIQGEDKIMKDIYDVVKNAEKKALENSNYAYWYLAFSLANTKSLVYEKKVYDSPKLFFSSHMDLSDLFSFASKFEDNQLIYCWLDINGYDNIVSKFKAIVSFHDKLEDSNQKALLNNLVEKLASDDLNR